MKLTSSLCLAALVFSSVLAVHAQPGGPGQALTFNGTDQYVELSSPPAPGANFTLEAWIYPQAADSAHYGFLGYAAPDSAQRSPGLWIANQTALHGGFGDGTAWQSFTTPSGVLKAQAWNHVAFTYDGSTMRVFVNGAWVYGQSLAATPFAQPIRHVGRVDNFFPGKIDEVRIWSVARTTNEIQQAMQHRLAGSEAGLVAYYHFDEGAGLATANAASAGGLSAGTLMGSPTWEVSTAPIGVSATMRDALILDADGDGKPSPGDKIRYTIVITNSLGISLNDAQFNNSLPPNATLVPGSFNTSPVARTDSYSAVGNTLLTVNAAAGVLVNDSDADNDTLTISAYDAASAHGGEIVLDTSSGSFTYLPAAGFTGTDTFTYSISDGKGTSARATASITVNNMVWYVDSAAAAGGDGRSTKPFQTFAALNGAGGAGDVDGPGQIIYVRNGSYSSSGILLEDNQQLVGAGVALVVNSQTLEPAGNSPVMAPEIGTAVVLAGNNLIRGVTITPLSGKGVAGTNFGTLNMDAVSISSSGGAALELNNGTVDATLTSLSSQFSTGEGLKLTSIMGNLTANGGTITSANLDDISITGGNANITYAGSVSDSSSRLISISGRTGGNVVFSGNLTDTGGTGILIQNNSSGSPTIVLNGTSKVLNTAGNSAVTLLNNSGATIQFLNGGLAISTTTAAALTMTGENELTISGPGNTIQSTSGTGLMVSGGSSPIDCNANISNTTGRVVDIQGRTGGTITLSGNLSNNGTGILVQNNNSGSGKVINFSGATIVLNTGINPAVLLNNNPNTTINFSGGHLDIDTTSGTGFYAVGNGTTISVTGSGNTIDSGTGAGLYVVNTAIGASGLTFQRISSNGGANTGIVLDNTGPTGGLTVTGTGWAGSGGTVANKSAADGNNYQGNGVYLNSCVNISLSWMQMNALQNFAIRGVGVNGFALSNSVINGVNGTSAGADEACVAFNNLTGIANIANCTISGGFEDNFRVVNASGMLNRITFTGVTFGLNDTSSGDNSLLLQVLNGAVLNATVQNCTFNGARGDVFQLDLVESSTGDLVFTGNTCLNTHPATAMGGGGITLSGGGSSFGNPGLTYDINNNTFRGARGDAVLVALQNSAGTFSGKIRNNIIGVAGTDKSGSSEASGIEVRVANSTGTQNVTIDSNQVRQYSNYGIYLAAGEGNLNGSINASVVNNTVSDRSSYTFVEFKRGIYLGMGVDPGDAYQACVDIKNNTTAGSGDGGASGPDIRLRQFIATCTTRLPGYTGGATDGAAVATFIANQNTGPETVTALGSQFSGGSACSTP